MKRFLIITAAIVAAVGIIAAIVVVMDRKNCTCLDRVKDFFNRTFTWRVKTEIEV